MIDLCTQGPSGDSGADGRPGLKGPRGYRGSIGSMGDRGEEGETVSVECQKGFLLPMYFDLSILKTCLNKQMNNFGVRRQRFGIDSLQIIDKNDANANAVIML